MGLFDKKYCDFCGKKIGLFGNNKLKDANMCDECARKLSPWFTNRRQSTKAEIQKQMSYRESNQQAVNAFHITRTLGRDTKLYLDEDNRKSLLACGANIRDSRPLDSIMERDVVTNYHVRQILRLRRELLDTLNAQK